MRVRGAGVCARAGGWGGVDDRRPAAGRGAHPPPHLRPPRRVATPRRMTLPPRPPGRTGPASPPTGPLRGAGAGVVTEGARTATGGAGQLGRMRDRARASPVCARRCARAINVTIVRTGLRVCMCGAGAPAGRPVAGPARR